MMQRPGMSESRIRIRMKVLSALFVLIFAAIGTRLWFLQVLASEQYTAVAQENHVRLVAIEPLRGIILDRNGKVLVGNRGSTLVTVDRQAIAGLENVVLPRLSELLGIPVREVEKRLETKRFAPYQPVPVAEDVSEETLFYLLEHPKLFPGVGYEQVARRDYPHQTLAAHILGYVGEVSEEQLELGSFADYDPGNIVGKAGVEATYEQYLYGTPGTRVLQVNAQGNVLNPEFRIKPPAPGDNLVMSIDLNVQRLAEESLQAGLELGRRTPVDPRDPGSPMLEADAGAVVVMDPRNGQVLALASTPAYDPSLFVGGLTRAEAQILNDPDTTPQFNRAIQGLYPAGSTFKPFVAAGALRQGFATTTGGYECPGKYVAPGDTSGTEYQNWNPVNQGVISLAESLVISCDTVYYPFGYRYWQQYFNSGKISEFMQDDLRAMGFGTPTGIDVPGEAAGLIPSDEYKFDLINENRDIYGPDELAIWLPGDYINMSIGQGLSLVTPLQLAVGYSAIANGGTLFQPHLALRVEGDDGSLVNRIEPQALGRLPITRKQVAFIRTALVGVPAYGTAEFAFQGFPLDRIPIAAKTGTAEVRPKQDFSWFAAMAPANDPKYVVVALIEQGGHGATTAAPVVRRILEGLFDLGFTELRHGGETD